MQVNKIWVEAFAALALNKFATFRHEISVVLPDFTGQNHMQQLQQSMSTSVANVQHQGSNICKLVSIPHTISNVLEL
jgi:hypothetical protein